MDGPERDDICNTTRHTFVPEKKKKMRINDHKTENVGQNCEHAYATANNTFLTRSFILWRTASRYSFFRDESLKKQGEKKKDKLFSCFSLFRSSRFFLYATHIPYSLETGDVPITCGKCLVLLDAFYPAALSEHRNRSKSFLNRDFAVLLAFTTLLKPSRINSKMLLAAVFPFQLELIRNFQKSIILSVAGKWRDVKWRFRRRDITDKSYPRQIDPAVISLLGPK